MTLETPLFTKINDNFTCVTCGFLVPKAQSTCRDHCPKCLYSMHVDLHPGDRSSQCQGILKPMAWSQHKKKGYMIHYSCQMCGEEKVNKFLMIDSFCADDFSVLVGLNSVTPCRESLI